jgi:hypothetical protein
VGRLTGEEEMMSDYPKVSGTVEHGEALGVKRLYLPGVTVEDRCPRCQRLQQYEKPCLYYPEIGKPSRVTFVCEPCDQEWEVQVTVRLSLELYGEEG